MLGGHGEMTEINYFYFTSANSIGSSIFFLIKFLSLLHLYASCD